MIPTVGWKGRLESSILIEPVQPRKVKNLVPCWSAVFCLTVQMCDVICSTLVHGGLNSQSSIQWGRCFFKTFQFGLRRYIQLSFRPKFPEVLVEWNIPFMYVRMPFLDTDFVFRIWNILKPVLKVKYSQKVLWCSCFKKNAMCTCSGQLISVV